MKAKKYTDGGIGPNKKRKAAEAAKKAQFEEQLANAVPSWQRAGLLAERLRGLHADMKSISEKERISMNEAYKRLNGDNWAEDPRYEERMKIINATESGGGSYAQGGKMRVKKYSTKPITPDPKKKAPVGGVAQRTKAEETAFEERRIEGMRESLREGEGLKSLQAYDKELTAKGYSFPNGSSNIKTIMKAKKFEQGGKIKAKKLQKTAEEAKKLAMALWVENYRNGIKTDKGKAANYPLAPWMKEYDFSGRPTYKTSDTGGTKAEAQRAAEMPSLSSTMGLGELKGRYLMRGRFEDIEGVSDNEKYDRKKANPNVKFDKGGKMKKK